MAFVDYNWANDDQFDVMRDKFNNAMTLADELPVLPIGSIIAYWGNPNDISLFDENGNGVPGSAMAKFALCLGQALTGSLLKTYEGGEQSLAPNLKGKFPVGWDNADEDYEEIGDGGGVKNVTLTALQSGLRAHSHVVPQTQTGSGVSNTHFYSANPGIGSGIATSAVAAQAASDSHENRPPFVTTGFIIRYK